MYLAYLDAGTGSQLAMAVVAGFAGTLVAVKLWWRRMLGALGRLRRRQPQPPDLESPARGDRDG